ncbi:MAG: class I tRNA ligase family protein, partial [Pseudomonadota bacterium]
RSKVVIEPMLTDQWFVDSARIVEPALEAVRDGRTQILPEQHRKVYFNWLENIEPWCISRQLWWGHQIPVWYGPTKEEIAAHPGEAATGEPTMFCAMSTEEVIAQARAYYGGDVQVDFFAGDPHRTMRGFDFEGGNLVGVTLTRDPDVLDTWFSSGLWPIGTLGWPQETEELERYFPTDVLITGFDIIFFWVARMMMMQLETVKEVPFHTVYVHALVRDEKGKKMSKSLGNVLDPLELIDEYGADAVRFTLTAMAAMGRDLKLSTSRIAGYRNFGTKLWNVARFAEMYGCKPVPLPETLTQTVNKWILGETARTRIAVDEALGQYRFNDAANALYAYVRNVVCDWYVEFSKPLLQGKDGPAKAETQAVMAWALDQCLLMLHPIMPFITEELWGSIADRRKMLVHGDWPSYGAEIADPAADAEMGWVIGLIEQIRSVRAEMNVSPAAKTGLVMVGADAESRARLENNWALISRLARVESVDWADAEPSGAVTLPLQGATACLPLAGLVDVAGEGKRLENALGKLGKEINGLTSKLGNEKFLAKAPEEVIAEQRERLAEAEAEAARLRRAQERVAALG